MSRRQFNQVRSCFVRISVILTIRLSYVLLDNVEKKKYRKLVKKKKEEMLGNITISTNVYQSCKVKERQRCACYERSTRVRTYANVRERTGRCSIICLARCARRILPVRERKGERAFALALGDASEVGQGACARIDNLPTRNG